ncbi:MAG: ZIP family metal transporter [Candidatus Micrarchaeota archaeon]|nr:ZIP family metal transporter [Candidatus Micrarchaeota archaeon]
METVLWIFLATIVDSLVGLMGIFSLWVRETVMKRVSLYLMAFAGGALLGGAFFHLLPEALEKNPVLAVFAFTVAGFIAFQLIETYLHWHFGKKCDVKPYSYLMVIGDAVHNTIDGLVIAASFIVSVPFGIITTIIIIAHEVPQELGIFGAIVYGGQKKETAIKYSFLAQTTCVLGGLAGYYLSGLSNAFSALLIPFAAGGFLYITAADLIPQIHEAKGSEKLSTFAVYLAGLAMMVALKLYFGGA